MCFSSFQFEFRWGVKWSVEIKAQKFVRLDDGKKEKVRKNISRLRRTTRELEKLNDSGDDVEKLAREKCCEVRTRARKATEGLFN